MPRVLITGAQGFLGSQIAMVLQAAGWEVVAGTRSVPETPLPIEHQVIDYADPFGAFTGIDAVIHAAIANDFNRLQADRRYAYDSYVGMTARLLHAAGERPFIFVSSDWTMDGTGHMVPEDEPPNPVNFYGLLKALGEVLVLDHGKTVVRVGGVMGQHGWAASSPRSQDVGFGYFTTSLIEALQSGRRFDVWTGEGVNEIATPSLGSHIGRGMQAILDRDARGIYHLVASTPIERLELARLTAEVFGLEASLVGTCPVPESGKFPAPVPRDTSLSSVATSDALGLAPQSVRELLEELRGNWR